MKGEAKLVGGAISHGEHGAIACKGAPERASSKQFIDNALLKL